MPAGWPAAAPPSNQLMLGSLTSAREAWRRRVGLVYRLPYNQTGALPPLPAKAVANG